ncbi:hypothetical protein ACHAWF_013746 [Thalassiosira exigua]
MDKEGNGVSSWPQEMISESKRLPQPPSWHPYEWSYAAEGGKHAIFRYSGSDCNFSGHVLRFVKRDLVKISSSVGRRNDATSSASTCKVVEMMEETPSPSQTFQRNIMQPILGSYLDLARVVWLPASYCELLHDGAVASGSIPPSRLASWKIDSKERGEMDSICSDGVRATLLRDHTQLPPHPSLLPLTSTVVSVEIKPKAGYITASPLVLPIHRCKYNRTRYSIQQELVQKDHVHKGWRRAEGGRRNDRSEDSFVPSRYSPLDLFSGNVSQIRKAAYDLTRNMQNNFRVWCNGKQIFGEYESASDNECKDIINNIHPSECDVSDPKPTLLAVIVEAISTVLDRERMLSNVSSIQQLDVIDGDGAVKVYERLVFLCKGSHLEAQHLLDDAALITREDWALEQGNDNQKILRDSSPYSCPMCKSLDKLLDAIEHFQLYMRKCRQKGSSPDEDVMNASHEKCMELVDELPKEACVYLLQNWLLSLALCDVSFFVTFRTMNCGNDVPEEFQSCQHGGIASFSFQDEGLAPQNMVIHYELKIIDCDPKPASKLRERANVESKFQFATCH